MGHLRNSKSPWGACYFHYEFQMLPFGLTNAQTTFEQLMNEIFRDELGDHIIVLLDDVLVLSKTFEDSIEHVHVFCNDFVNTSFMQNYQSVSFSKKKSHTWNIIYH